MDEIVVQRWCDVCFQRDGRRSPVVATFVVAIAEDRRDSVPRQVVACADHAGTVREFASMVKLAGAKVDVPLDGRRACPVCEVKMGHASVVGHLVARHGAKPLVQPARCPDCGHRVASSKGMTLHRRQKHGYDHVAEMVASVKGKGARKG